MQSFCYQRYNRTYVELKQKFKIGIVDSGQSYNRTYVELKHFGHNLRHTNYKVIIALM